MQERKMCFSDEDLMEIRDSYYYPLVNNEWSKIKFYNVDDSSRSRNDYQRDYTRIIYSSSFRRLQGKMQLLGIENDRFFRNRLTHSIEVAQIARSIAEDIGQRISLISSNSQNIYVNDLYVVEAASLAHDIGNPPFGHKGERVLNSICSHNFGFEGNAQTLRVLMDLEKKFPDIGGLNLTIRTLLGVTKYYKRFSEKSDEGGVHVNDKFIYDDTFSRLEEIINSYNITVRTLDVQIIDLADEIAYAAHDLEDALSMNMFTIDELLFEFMLLSKKKGYENSYEQLKIIVDKARGKAEKAQRFHSSEEYSYIFKKELTSIIVNELINDIGLIQVKEDDMKKTGTKYEKELDFTEFDGLAKGLKDKVFDCINRRDYVQLYEAQGEKIIRGLYNVFIDNDKYLPVEFRFNGCSECEKQRKVIDYISGMMDSYAISSYIKFYGASSLDKMFIESIKK